MKFSEMTEKEIVSRYKAGESTVVLGQVYGMTRGGIRALLTRYKVERRKIGERPPRSDATLYQFDVSLLVKLVQQGMSVREIARILNVSPSVVYAS